MPQEELSGVQRANRDLSTSAITGGSVRVTIAATVGQGNGGTTRPCKLCYVSMPATNTGPVRMNVSAAASATVGIEVPEASSPVFIPIDDVAKLYFYSATNGDVIDILWIN